MFNIFFFVVSSKCVTVICHIFGNDFAFVEKTCLFINRILSNEIRNELSWIRVIKLILARYIFSPGDGKPFIGIEAF